MITIAALLRDLMDQEIAMFSSSKLQRNERGSQRVGIYSEEIFVSCLYKQGLKHALFFQDMTKFQKMFY